MSQVSHPLPIAGDYLVATFADIMHSAAFRKHVWRKMQLAERRRLESLRLQALYGNAPATPDSDRQDGPIGTAAAVAERKEVSDRNKGELTAPAVAASSPSSSSAPVGTSTKTLPHTQATPSPPRWFDIAGRARYNAWVSLRGSMSPDVAAECFCAEFLGVIKKYPHPTLLSPVEAALSTAHGLAQRARSRGRRIPRSIGGPATPPSKAMPVFQVRALQGDPAALALLWVCRAYRIPCEFVVEPLSKAMGCHRTSFSSPATAAASANPYLTYTMADACYPFSASLIYPTSTSTTEAGGLPKTGTNAANVTTPESAFVLIADAFLAAYQHWMGVPSDSSASSLSSSTFPSSQVLFHRCSWIDELQHITRHIRTPILALLVHYATALSSSTSSSTAFVETPERTQLLRAVAAHLHRYESWAMEKIISRRVGQAQSVLSPLLASTAVVDALQHAYAPDEKPVTAADVFLASCGYVFCTHPFCADVFPLLRVPWKDGEGEGVRSQWPSSEQAAVKSESASTYAPWALPLYLSGLPAEYNEKINRLLRRETKGAMQHEKQQQPVRLFIHNEPVTIQDLAVNSDLQRSTPPHQQQQQRNAGYYEVSSATTTKEAAEAVGQLIAARLLLLRSDDLQHGHVTDSNSSVSGAPFLVLGNVFALTWALAQEQVPAFPYFMLDGNPDHFGGFSFLREVGGEEEGARKSTASANKKDSGNGSEGTASTVSRARPRFQVSLAPAAVRSSAGNPAPVMLPTLVQGSTPTPSASSHDGGRSVESRLRNGLHLAGSALLKGVRRLAGSSREEDAQAWRSSSVLATHVLRSEGEGNSNTSSGAAALSTAEVGPARL